jgi:hypothetical protein
MTGTGAHRSGATAVMVNFPEQEMENRKIFINILIRYFLSSQICAKGVIPERE